MPRIRASKTTYLCDAPGCQVATENTQIVKQRWITVRQPLNSDGMFTYYHNLHCVARHFTLLSDASYNATVMARIGEPRPAGQAS